MATKKTVKTAVKKTTSSRTADAKAGPKKPAAATKPPAGKLPAAKPPATTKKAAKKSAAKGRSTALQAAAQVLAETQRPLTCKQLIEAMAEKGYWTSPAGKTPHATLYSSILRQITKRGKDAPFKKVQSGKFTLNG